MKGLLIIFTAIFLFACSTTTSTIVKDKYIDGLTYFMPNKDFIVTITMGEPNSEGKSVVSDITFLTSEAYADRTEQYVLQSGTNWLNDNKLAVTVDTTGLLKTSTSTSKSKVEDVLEGLAATAGYHTLVAPDCNKAGDYIFVFKPSDPKTIKCGVEIEISPLPLSENTIKSHTKTSGSAHSGVFYRQNEAYKITATVGSGNINKEAILYSPSNSETLFLPISRSFFADSEATFTFIDGMPTGYTQDDKSEFVGAFAIPAKIIGAYFAAVGELFAAFSNKNTNESALIKSESALDLEKHKAQRDLELSKIESDYKFKLAELKVLACESAVADNNQDLIDSLGCSN